MEENICKKFENLISNTVAEPQTGFIQQPEKLNEAEMEVAQNIVVQPINNISVKRAYCPQCGNELVSQFPAMFNPFTQEKQCIHKCSCGKMYNLEYSYPRIVFSDENNKEIFVHCE